MEKYVNKHRRAVDFSVGDLVWLKTEHLPLGAHLSRKLAPKWVGPFKILQEINPVAFKLELPVKFNKMHPVFHSSQLKLHSGAVEPSPAPIFDDSAG